MQNTNEQKHLTDREFWVSYWENKEGIVQWIKPTYPFASIFKKYIEKYAINSAVELGGFPGYYSIFLKKYFGLKTTLVDYFIHPEIIKKLSKQNNLQPDDIEIIEADLFHTKTATTYDLVFSCGLIEHFSNTEEIIEKHLTYLNTNGILLITLPNFKGINGWFQRKFDPENYSKHYINCMDLNYLNSVMKSLNMEVLELEYHGKFSVWLENYDKQSALVKVFLKLTWLTGKIITKLIPLESKLFSPYIFLVAKPN